VTGHYTLMSCNGLEWIQPPSNESRLPGCYAYYDPPARIVDELNRLVDQNKRLEEALEATAKVIGPPGKSTWVSDDELNHAWELYIKAKEAKP
jgi:hypothetical protein